MSRSSAAQADVFAALGDATRLELVSRLCAGPASIAALASGASITRQAITKHLEVLAQAGLVHDAKHGRERLFELEARRLDDARAYLERLSARWDTRLEQLKKLVEDTD